MIQKVSCVIMPTFSGVFFSLLSALEVLTLIWFGMILKVAYGVLSGKGADDSRSDGEESDVEVEEYEEEDVSLDLPSTEFSKPEISSLDSDTPDSALEEARGTKRPESPAAAGRGRRTRGAARTSAISIPGHGDRKELLGRIGCDKPS